MSEARQFPAREFIEGAGDDAVMAPAALRHLLGRGRRSLSPAAGADDADDHSPVKRGGRFSTNAAIPSFASSLANSSPKRFPSAARF